MAITTHAAYTDSVEAREDMDIFYITLVGIFVAELIIEKGIVKMLYRHVDSFKKEGFQRRGFAGLLAKVNVVTTYTKVHVL